MRHKKGRKETDFLFLAGPAVPAINSIVSRCTFPTKVEGRSLACSTILERVQIIKDTGAGDADVKGAHSGFACR